MNGEDHSVVGAELVEGRKHGVPDPVEDLSQLAEEGQGGRRSCRDKRRLLSLYLPSLDPFPVPSVQDFLKHILMFNVISSSSPPQQ